MLEITTDKKGLREIIILIVLFSCIDFWIFFLCLLSLGKQSVLGWILSFLLSILIDAIIYLNDTIYSIENETFIIKKRWNEFFKNSSLISKKKHLKVDAVSHATIDIVVNPVYYNHTIHVKLQLKESKGKFLNFAILKDTDFKSFIQFLLFLQRKDISYTILNNKSQKLKKLLAQQDISLSFKPRL